MSNWLPISEIKDERQTARFIAATGEEFLGQWAPFWCGSDCPCDVADEGFSPCDQSPLCWCAYREGNTRGEDATPTHFAPIQPLKGE